MKTIADVKMDKRMEIWNAKIETQLIADRYFITSEDNYNETTRIYTLRMVVDWQTGKINTYGPFEEFKTLVEAKERLKELLKG